MQSPNQGQGSAGPAALFELAQTCAAMSFHESAIETLREVVALAPGHVRAWQSLTALLRLAGEDKQADQAGLATERARKAGRNWPEAAVEDSAPALEAAEMRLHDLLRRTPLQDRMTALRDHLVDNPMDVTAMRALSQLEWRGNDGVTARHLLERALALAPGYVDARRDYVEILAERRQHVRVLAQTEALAAAGVRDARLRTMRANALGQVGRFGDAIVEYEALIAEDPDDVRYRLALAGALHYVGRRDDAVRAYRDCLALDPQAGQAYWGLADLKGNYLGSNDIAALQSRLQQGEPNAASRMHMAYALAHALERAGNYAESFAAYQLGAKAFQESATQTSKAYDPVFMADRIRRSKSVFSADHLQQRPPEPDAANQLDTPIFIVGMPRAGSTLVEQILASHSLVEGTRELPVMPDIIRDLTLSRAMVTEQAYPECVLDLTPDELAALGRRYVADAGAYRHTKRPYFIDKRPWNWLNAGLIHLILPRAKIVDVRREPMAACFAMFKQVLPAAAAFSYDLGELGRAYQSYAGMMTHYEAAMPGRIHFLEYERLVADTEAEIRRLLDYCGLPFEDACLRFWETDRAVFTPSAEQVRRPIFRDAVEQWRHFEPWLGELKAALA